MSAILELRVQPGKPVLRGNDHYWSVIRDLTANDHDQTFTVCHILDSSSKGDKSSIRKFLLNLERGGFVEGETAYKLFEDRRWRVLRRPRQTPSLGKDGKLRSTGTEAMWNAIRALGSFSARELTVSASTEEQPIALNTAKSYLQRLLAAGYLKVEQAATYKSLAIYRLKPSMNTGPLPPKILRTKLVYDENRNEIMGRVFAEEDRP